MRKASWIIFLLLGFVITIAAQDTTHIVSDAKWHRGAVDNAYMNRQIEQAAEEYKQYAPIVRIAFYDIGFPKDKAECEGLGGYGILLITALSQDGSELPVKRAYVASGGKEIELTKLNDLYIKVPTTDSQIVKTFGQYRVDSLYLFPVYARSLAGELRVDFSANRNGMKVAAFDGSTPDGLKFLPMTKPSVAKPGDAALTAFLKREYPAYSDQ